MCWSSFLRKLKALGLQLFQRNSSLGVFLWTLRNFSAHHFYRILRTTVSVSGGVQSSNQLLFLRTQPSGGTTCWYQPWFNFFLFYLSVCLNIQDLTSYPAGVLASPNLFTLEIKDWRSLMSARSSEHWTFNEWKLALTLFWFSNEDFLNYFLFLLTSNFLYSVFVFTLLLDFHEICWSFPLFYFKYI